MTKQEFDQLISQYDGKLIDATALAQYHYKLKKEVIDEIDKKLPHTVIITPDSYSQLGNNSIEITGFSTFPQSIDYTYYLLVNNVEELIPSSAFDIYNNITISKQFNSSCRIQIIVKDTNNQVIGVSNIATITKYEAIKTIIWNSDSQESEILTKSVDNPIRTTYKGQLHFERPNNATDPVTMWISIPTVLDAPERIMGSNFAVFEYQSSEENYDIYALNQNLDPTRQSEDIILQ